VTGPGAPPGAGRLAAFLVELRRRRVFRALLGWGVVSFAALQVAEPLIHGLDLPEWTLKAAIWALAAGFPATSLLAWLFDLGPGGITRTAEAAPPAGLPAPAAAGQSARRKAALAGLVVASALFGAALAAGTLRHLDRQPPPGPEGRIVVAVADFANETRDPDLDGLASLLTTSLEQSQRLRVLTRSRMVDVLRQMGKPQVERIDEVVGRDLARAAGVRALMVASVRRFEQVYAIDLKVLDPATSDYLFTLKEERSGKGAIPGMLDRLSERARQRLREAPAEVGAARVDLAEATTRNPEAWRHYAEGMKQEAAGQVGEAVRAYRKAAEADPRFALAHYRVAYLGEFVRLDVRIRQAAMEAAIREVDRMPAKERLLFRAWKAHMDGRDDDARALYAGAAEAYPLDKEVLYLAGDLLLHAGDVAGAAPWFEKAVALDPTWPEALGHLLLDTLPELGRGEEALERARRWAGEAPGVQSQGVLLGLLSAAGRRDEALELARQLYARDRGSIRDGLVTRLVLSERFEEAEALLRSLAAPSAPPEGRADALMMLVSVLDHQGRRREALEAGRLGAALPGVPSVRIHWVRWQILQDGADRSAALREAEAIRAAGEDSGRLTAGYLLLGEDRLADEAAAGLSPAGREGHEALTAWRQGDRGRALAGLRKLVGQDLFGRDLWSWWLAYLGFEEGASAEVLAAADRVERSPALALGWWRGWGVARMLLRKAEAQARAGDRVAALATVGRMLGWWKRADADYPHLVAARSLKRRLERQGAGGKP